MNGWGKPEPAWWLNLQAQPEATIDLATGERMSVHGRAATGEERARLWANWHDYGDDVDGFLCALVQNSDVPSKDEACELFSRIFEPLPSTDPELNQGRSVRPVSGQVSQDYLESGPATTLRDLLGGGA